MSESANINLGLSVTEISVVVRTLNEGRYLDNLLKSINRQAFKSFIVQPIVNVVLVDSGSSDNTLAVASSHGVEIVKIRQADFSFGYSLNTGCHNASGQILVFVSGHCLPQGDDWIDCLIRPLLNGQCSYVYGRQLPVEETNFSEAQIFRRHYPDYDKRPQKSCFINNANAAIVKSVWEQYRFCEKVKGCEDIEFATRMQVDGHRIGYVSSAPVFHVHDESCWQVARRFEREAATVSSIFSEKRISACTTIMLAMRCVKSDLRRAKISCKLSPRTIFSILWYRLAQFVGNFNGGSRVLCFGNLRTKTAPKVNSNLEAKK